MRTFAQKQKPTQKLKSEIPTGPGKVITRQNNAGSFILQLQRSIGNSTVQRVLQGMRESRTRLSPQLMVAGTPASIQRGAAPQIARQPSDAPATESPGNTPRFVAFDQNGNWDGPSVEAHLKSIVPVPPDLATAIRQSRGMTALYCIDLRTAVSMTGATQTRKSRYEQIANTLSSRINELTYATSRSPLTYRQLAQIARWSAEFGDLSRSNAEQSTEQAQAAPPLIDPVEAHAAKLAGRSDTFPVEISKNVVRKDVTPALGPNRESSGEDALPPLPGYRFIHDPFDNTVTAVKPDGTGIQYTYQTVTSDTGPQIRLVHTEQLSELRVGALDRMNQAALGEAQEDTSGRQARLAADQKTGDEKRKEWEERHPAEAEAYHKKLEEWNQLSAAEKKKTPLPRPPAGYPGNPLTTDCPLWCTPSYRAGGGVGPSFPFTPPKQWKAFRTLKDHPEGPRPGDVYWLNFKSGSTAHMGVFKSRTPVPGQEDMEMWAVTDGGQGGYQSIQMVVERTRGPFNTKTGVFNETSDSGQKADRRVLAGWVDIDAHNREHARPIDI